MGKSSKNLQSSFDFLCYDFMHFFEITHIQKLRVEKEIHEENAIQ